MRAWGVPSSKIATRPSKILAHSVSGRSVIPTSLKSDSGFPSRKGFRYPTSSTSSSGTFKSLFRTSESTSPLTA